MTSYATYNARRTGDFTFLMHVVLANRHQSQPYPALFRGAWFGADRNKFTPVTIPVDYGSAPPYTIDDLCTHYWFKGGSPFELNTRLRLFQTKTVTRDPVTEEPLSRPFTIFSFYTAPAKQNKILLNKGCIWYGDFLVVMNETENSTRIVSVADNEDMEPFVDIITEHELTQADPDDI